MSRVVVKTQELKESLERMVLLIRERSQADETVGRVSYKNLRLYCKTEDTRASLEVPFLEGCQDFCVEGMDFYRYVQKLKDENITLEFGKTLLVLGKRTKAQFPLFEPFDFPLPSKWKTVGPDFIATLEEVSKFVSKTYYRPVLTAVCVKGNSMQATDSLLYYKKLGKETFLQEKEVLIPGPSVPFIKLLDPDKFFIDDNIMYFKQQPTLIGACSLLSGAYPDVTRMEQDLKKGKRVSFSEETRDAVDRCSVFTEGERFDDNKKIYVTLKEGKALLTAKAIVGSNKERVDAEYDKSLEGVSFCLRPSFFGEILTKGVDFSLCAESLQIQNETLWCVSAIMSRS